MYITDETKQMAQLVKDLRKQALTWFMNFTDSQIKTKTEIKSNFLMFFKTQDIKHLTLGRTKA